MVCPCFENWRFNLRKSNTEPLVRLNIETRGDQSLLEEKKEELKTLIKSLQLEIEKSNTNKK